MSVREEANRELDLFATESLNEASGAPLTPEVRCRFQCYPDTMPPRTANPSPVIAFVVLGAVILVSVTIAAIHALVLWLLADTPPSE